MRARGCVVWYFNGVCQVPGKDGGVPGKNGGDGVDTIVARIMADAEIAQDKRSRACKWARR